MNNMSQYNNTPDEAERLLDALVGADRDYVMAYKPSFRADAEALRQRSVSRLESLRAQLLPLLQAGLTLQRLEKAMRETGMECANVGTNKDGAWCFLQCRDFSEPEGDGDTIPEAITAALDAAGVE